MRVADSFCSSLGHAAFQYLVPVGVALAVAFLVNRLLAPRWASTAPTVQGRHVWIVGASQGIGAELARQLYGLGPRKLTLSSRDGAALASVRESLLRQGRSGDGDGSRGGGVCSVEGRHDKGVDVDGDVEICVLPFDVRNTDYTVVAHPPPQDVDVLVLNAGVNQRDLPLSALDAATVECVIDTNFRGPVRLIHHLLPGLSARGGTVCVVSSQAARLPLPGASVYGATKAALSAFAASLAIELQALRARVRVVAVHPGFVHTPAIAHLHHPKPAAVSPATAARHIVNAIHSPAPYCRTGFPALMHHAVVPAAQALPAHVYNFVLARVFRKDLQHNLHVTPPLHQENKTLHPTASRPAVRHHPT